jgi:hypothetical protein
VHVEPERIDGPEMRLYRTPEGNLYPSVTTVLGAQPRPELDAWVSRVGEAEAKRVSERATIRGSAVHQLAEDYLNNRLDLAAANPMYAQDFLPIMRELDEHVDDVISTEIKLYSDRLMVAGTTDLIAGWDGKTCIIDFKTSRRLKHESDILGYFVQGSVYSFMVYERLGLLVEDVVIVMMVDGDSRAQVFRKKAKDYLPTFLAWREDFRSLKGI